MANQHHFCAISKLTFEHEPGASTSAVRSADIRLEVSDNLKKSVYLDEDNLPTKLGLKPLSAALIMGLVVNMRMGAQKGWWKEGEHMRYIMDELQRAFVAPASNVRETTMEY